MARFWSFWSAPPARELEATVGERLDSDGDLRFRPVESFSMYLTGALFTTFCFEGLVPLCRPHAQPVPVLLQRSPRSMDIASILALLHHQAFGPGALFEVLLHAS